MLNKKLISLFLVVGLFSSATTHPLWGFDWFFGSSNQTTANTEKKLNAVIVGAAVVTVGMAAYTIINSYRANKNIAARSAALKIHDDETAKNITRVGEEAAQEINRMKEESAKNLKIHDEKTVQEINRMKEEFRQRHVVAEEQLDGATKEFEKKTAELREQQAQLVAAYEAKVASLAVYKAKLTADALEPHKDLVAAYIAQQREKAERVRQRFMFYGKYDQKLSAHKGHCTAAQTPKQERAKTQEVG